MAQIVFTYQHTILLSKAHIVHKDILKIMITNLHNLKKNIMTRKDHALYYNVKVYIKNLPLKNNFQIISNPLSIKN